MLHKKYTRNYETIRWNFDWKKHVVLGEPDGITDEYIYEFKSTQDGDSLESTKLTAELQADLYGYFFKRAIKKIQIYVVNDNTTHTFKSEVDRENAENALNFFEEIDRGEKPTEPAETSSKRETTVSGNGPE